MPIFLVEQYERCSTTYRIQAESEAEAVKKVLDGDYGDLGISGSAQEYIEVDNDVGISIDQDRELFDEVQALVPDYCSDGFIDSIRSVEYEEEQ